MPNPQESTIAMKQYLKKLYNLIEKGATFSFITTKIVDKKKVDDILCCIEASWPDDYKAYIKKGGPKKLESNKYYKQLLDSVKNKFLFSTNVYSVRYKYALPLITSILNSLDSDINYIHSDQSGMF